MYKRLVWAISGVVECGMSTYVKLYCTTQALFVEHQQCNWAERRMIAQVLF
jgi:hypothetical protein